jgi:3-oxoacyl-[acyl-carrier-protein] synthase III
MLHARYGNCAESSVPVTLRHCLDHGLLKPGMRAVLVAAASGYVMASVAVEWE